MNEITLTCPRCKKLIEATISDIELKRLWSGYCGSKRSLAKSNAARENGRLYGGRPIGSKDKRPRKKQRFNALLSLA